MKKANQKMDAVLPEPLVVQLLAAMPPGASAAGPKRRAAMKQKLLARIGESLREDAEIDAAAGMRIVRAGEGHWINFAPNVQMKVLHDDGDTRTWLARFQAGGRIRAHLQTGDEEAIVLEGWCHVGEHEMRAGDYQLIPRGARHGEIVSPEGCLIFVRSHSEKKRASDLAATR